jgi:hypothetical protein
VYGVCYNTDSSQVNAAVRTSKFRTAVMFAITGLEAHIVYVYTLPICSLPLHQNPHAQSQWLISLRLKSFATLGNDQLDALFLNVFILCLYMFREASAHHQEGQIVPIHRLV